MFLKNLHWVCLILTIVFFGGYLNYESNNFFFFVSCVSNIHISIFEPIEDNFNSYMRLFTFLILIAFLFSYLGSIYSILYEPEFTFLDWIKIILF
jgi:hypothetical protein